MDTLESMNDDSFEKFISCQHCGPIIPSGLHMRVHWLQQNWLFSEWLEDRTPERLAKVFGLFGNQENVSTLRLDRDAATPFLGEWFSKVWLGRNVTIKAGAIIMAHGGISLNDGASIGQGAMLITVGHPIHPTQRHLQSLGPISIGNNALIGADALVVNGNKIDPTSVGEGSIVLPGAIITKDIPPYCVVGGVNKILLQGKEYFLPAHNFATPPQNLENRLTSQGIQIVSGAIAKNVDLTVSAERNLLPSTQIYAGKDAQERYAFFAGSEHYDLDTCVLNPPVYITGEIPIIKTGMVLNRRCSINTASGGKIVFSKGTLMAPQSSIDVEEGGTLVFEDVTWVGAGTKIIVPKGKTLTIGSGSVLAAGAQITGNDVLPMSLVIGEGKCLRAIGDNDIADIPPQWMDIPRYRQYHVDTMKLGQELGPIGRQEIIDSLQCTKKIQVPSSKCNRSLSSTL